MQERGNPSCNKKGGSWTSETYSFPVGTEVEHDTKKMKGAWGIKVSYILLFKLEDH